MDQSLDPLHRPLPPVATYGVVVERIRRALLLGIYVQGERLPSERTLAADLGVARATVREALRVLEGAGHLAVQRGAQGGPVVLAGPDPTPETLRAQLPAFEDLLDFRLAVEGAAARLAAQRRTEEDLGRLQTALDAMRLHTSMPLFRRGDSAFHLAIAAAARNERLYRAVEDGRAAMFSPLDALDFAVMQAKALEGHRAVLAAIIIGDGAVAERASHAHIEDTRRELRLVLSMRAGAAAGWKG